MSFLVWYFLGIVGVCMCQIAHNFIKNSHWAQTTPANIALGLIFAVGGPVMVVWGIIFCGVGIAIIIIEMPWNREFWCKEIQFFKRKDR